MSQGKWEASWAILRFHSPWKRTLTLAEREAICRRSELGGWLIQSSPVNNVNLWTRKSFSTEPPLYCPKDQVTGWGGGGALTGAKLSWSKNDVFQ